jgi:hypothetical protein
VLEALRGARGVSGNPSEEEIAEGLRGSVVDRERAPVEISFELHAAGDEVTVKVVRACVNDAI